MVSKNTRGRPEKLTEKRKKDVVAVFEQNPDSKIKKIYKQASAIWVADITKEIRREYPEITSQQLKEEINERMPGYDTIRNYYNETIKPNADKLKGNPLDTPWSMGALAQYPIPPEALPVVLRAFYAERSTDSKTDEYFRIGQESGHETYLTIRQILWMARLSPLFKYPTYVVSASPEEDIAQCAKFNLVTAELVFWAQMYALQERTDEIMGKPLPFDTSNLDMNLLWRATAEIYPSLVSHPSLIRYSWEATLNHLKKEA